uniref:Uncharacterized protein n=1 Tax=Micrurus lemniscatus lemniscatus TaxID=129467 RepID=A0A2D4HAU9_MICLE
MLKEVVFNDCKWPGPQFYSLLEYPVCKSNLIQTLQLKKQLSVMFMWASRFTCQLFFSNHVKHLKYEIDHVLRKGQTPPFSCKFPKDTSVARIFKGQANASEPRDYSFNWNVGGA